MDELGNFDKEERKTMENTRDDFSTELEIFRNSFNLTVEILDSICDKYQKPKTVPHRLTPLTLMIPRLLSTSKSVLKLCMSGYYYDAQILMRAFMENLGLCVYLARHEDKVKEWLNGKKIVSYIRLVDEIVFLFGGENKKDVGRYLRLIHSVYGQASSYVHGDVRALMQFIEPRRKPRIDLSYLPSYKKKEMRASGALGAPAFLNLVLILLLKNEIQADFRNKVLSSVREYRRAQKC